jgi:hypothetical protein
MKMIYAVVWVDFGIPLTLKCASADAAIAKAKDMAARAALQHLRAVSLDPDDVLVTLWSAEREQPAAT